MNRDYPLSKGYEPLEGNYAVYLNHATKQVEALLQDPDSFFWNGVKLYYKANQMGILDPGAVTMSSTGVYGKESIRDLSFRCQRLAGNEQRSYPGRAGNEGCGLYAHEAP